MSIDSQLLNLTGGIKTSGHIKSNFGATIGVGTDAPTGIVEVQHSQPTLVVQQQATSGGSVTSYGKVHAASGTLHIQSGIDATSDSKGDIVLGSVGSGTKHVVVKGATSRVGIGSDAPAYGLDVVPESRFTGNVIASNISTNVLTLNELTLGVTQGLDNVVNVDNTTSNTIAMSNVDASTSTTTGALTVAGGIGVGGNVHCANLYASNIAMVRKLELQDGGLGLKRGSNVSVSGTPSVVIQEITGPHARESAVLKKYPEVVFMREKMEYNEDSNTFTQGGYTITSSSNYGGVDTLFTGWRSFTGLTNGFGPGWTSKNNGAYTNSLANGTESLSGIDATTSTGSVSSRDGAWLKLKLPTKIKLYQVHVYDRYDDSQQTSHERVQEAYVYGSNDNSTWYELGKQSTATNNSAYTDDTPAIITINATTAYKYFIIQPTVLSHALTYASYGQVMYYGYEEVGAGDDSVDTTVKSVYNAPDLTSAALYIDAAKTGTSVTDQSGSTPSVTVTATGVTYDSTEKAWELTGAATSNIVSGDLASLVGDHPHSVSAWVKADQLNGDGLFHVGTAEGEGDAASRVGFLDDSHISYGGEDHFFSNAEWHNVTYTYNGEGSDKKLYLDGRLVDTAKNEDTFGDYPPFAMTNYSEYGYTVSASSELAGGGYKAWEAFDNTTGGTSGGGGAADQAWISANSTYTGSTYHSTKNLGTDHGGSATTSGEYLILELPHKLILSYVAISPRGSDADRAPRDGKVYGSNDNVNWTEIGSFTGLTHSTGSYASVVVNANSGFKMFAIVTTAILNSVTSTWLGIGELKYYGHRENDLVRFPDSVNTLKYPHVAMTGPAQRGYVASASSQFHDGNYPPYNAFNNVFTGSDPTHTWNSKASAYHTSSDGEYNGSDNFSTTISGTAYAGEWIQIELPRKVVASALKLGSYGSNSGRSPRAGAFAGSNDGSTWDLLKTYSGETSWTQGTLKSFAPNNNTATAYKYFRFVITRVQVTNDGLTALQAFEVHGTESGDVVARVGDGFDGKVRNLRVYSTALSDARVQEIFDADKDEFGLAKSSISVYRGKLGVGTSEPKAALTVMDEVGELEEFPPRAGGFDGDEWYIDGHGTFRANASNYHSSTDYAPGRAFTKSLIINFGYASQASNSLRWEGNGGLPNTSPASGFDPVGIFEGRRGDWLELELPYRIYVKKFQIQTRLWLGSPRDHPKNGALYGSNDRNTWTELTEFTNLSYTPSELDGIGGHTANWTVNSTSSYKYLRLLTTQKIDGTDDWLMISELRYFGTREQGASTLHNGELTLTRNLAVPRIGPPLDADDTPRRDRLVVEYNTTTNPVENGVVKDTSGRGLDGKMVGVTYDATDKYFVSTASDGSQWIDTRIHSGGSQLSEGISGSIWVNMKYFDTSTKNSFIWSVGDRSGTGNNREIAVGYNIVGGTLKSFVTSFIGGTGNFNLSHTSETPFGVWTHVGMTYDGTNVKLYINGVYSVSTTTTDVNIPETNCFLRLNGDVVSANSTHQGTPMSLSNFKLYDVALAADEVKRLYDMGRCDEGNHTTVVSRSKLQMSGEQLILEPCIKGFYEEGTWTPIIYGSLGGEKTPTTSNYGWFVRVGNMVTIGGTISWSGGSTMVGQVRLKTLPYVSRATPNTNRSAISFGVTASGIITGSGFNTIRLVIDPGTNFIYVMQSNEYRSTTVTYSHYPGIASSGNIYGIGGSYMI